MSPEKQKMLSGGLYLSSDPELAAERLRARGLCYEYNSSHEDETERRREILTKLLDTIGSEITIEPSFKCDYGYNIQVGDNFYANFDLIILDVCEVRIGKNCFIGPRVSILTATHPVDPADRATGREYGSGITIGDDVWIGAGVIINPGVTLGDGVVVGSGAVVTRSFGAGVVIAGVPAKVIREFHPLG